MGGRKISWLRAVCHRHRFVLLFVIVVLLLSNGLIAASGDRSIRVKPTSRLALVIGNGSYVSAPLLNPVNDARDMRDLLTGLEFKVTHLENVGQRQMEDDIRAFGADLRRTGGLGLYDMSGNVWE